MDVQRVDLYLMTNNKFFPQQQMMFLRERMLMMDEQRFVMLNMTNLNDPIVLFIISFFLGYLGIDRFMIGDIGMGILKLLTFGVFGILTIIDWFLIMGRTRQKNLQKIMPLL